MGNRPRARRQSEESLETFRAVLEELRGIERLQETSDHHIQRIETLESEAEELHRRMSG